MQVLVLSVDRDDDLGKMTGIKGPIIGREKNIKAGEALILKDPAEADANTIFEAVRIFDELKDAVDVVTLTGHSDRGYKADKNISSQLDRVFKKYEKLDGVYLVTDGADDDQIIPIIQSKTKIISKKTLIIKQAKELEKSYYVIKQALSDPHFARLVFGLPGVILLIIAFFKDLGYQIIVLAIGLYLLIKGFGIEEPILRSVNSFRETTSIERASFPLYIASFLTLILSVWGGFEKLGAVREPLLLKQWAAFASGFIGLFVLAVILFLVGRIGDLHYKGEGLKVRKHSMSIVTVLAIWVVVLKGNALIFGEIGMSEFIAYLFLAFFASIIGLAVIRKIYLKKYVVKKLHKGLEVYNQSGDRLGVLSEIDRKAKNILVEAEKEKIKIPFHQIIIVKEFVSVKA